VIPLFVCHANCSRSMIADYLFRDIAGTPALSAGMQAGESPAERAVEMLAYWGVDASAHRPRQVDRAVCDQAGAIFVMAAPYLRRLLLEYGDDLAIKSYLFADPFTRPVCLAHREYAVIDPTWDHRAACDLCAEHAWMRDRVAQIDEALHGRGRPLVPAAGYLDLLAEVDPKDH
jgi:Low molecular weight phosphotyrosine protein phosphatase